MSEHPHTYAVRPVPDAHAACTLALDPDAVRRRREALARFVAALTDLQRELAAFADELALIGSGR